MATIWSMQLHPNNVFEFPTNRIKHILRKRHVVGIGGDSGDIQRFQNEAQVGDVVLVRNGASYVALVELSSDAYANPNQDNDCWYDVVRNVKLISDAPERYTEKYSSIYGKDPTDGLRIRGTFLRVRSNNVVAFVNYWMEQTKGGVMVNELVDWLSQTNIKQIIFTGAPGTGKTFLARQIAQKMILGHVVDDEKTLSSEEKEALEEQLGFCQFHPSMDYTDFVEGLRPVKTGTEEESIGFERRDGIFKAFCRKAIKGGGDAKCQDNFDEAWDVLLSKIEESETEILRIPLQSSKSLDIELNMRGTGLASRVYGEDGNWIQGRSKFFTKKQVYRVYRKMKGVPSGGHDNYRRRIVEFMKANCGLVEYQEGLLKEDNRQSPPYVFIIDEINRGDIAKIFGELFFAIDPDYRGTKGRITTQYANLAEDDIEFEQGFYVPENVFILGTMNDIDRGVESMDFAIRRRFVWKEITPVETQSAILGKAIQDDSLRERATVRMNNLNKAISEDGDYGLGPAFQIGAAYFAKLDGDDFETLWKSRVGPLLLEYMRGQEKVKERFEKYKNEFNNENNTPTPQNT